MRNAACVVNPKTYSIATGAACCLLLFALLPLCPGQARAQQKGEQIVLPAIAPEKLPAAPTADVLATLVDDRLPGMVRLGNIQILYGVMAVPCDAPVEICQVTVKFPAPFVEPPVVSFTNVANYQTQKVANAWLYKDRLSPTQFTARVAMQANVKDLRAIPWMAIGRWR